MVNPQQMCRQHLLGEHVECHMFVGTVRRGKNVQGYLDKGLLEVHNIQNRHDELAGEMLKRGYKHKSPISFASKKLGTINSRKNINLLHDRCEKCS